MPISSRAPLFRFLAAALFAAAAACIPVAAAPPAAVNADSADDSRKDSQPSFAVDAAGNMTIAVWMAPGPNGLDPNGSDLGTANTLNDDLFYARSTDGGVSWTSMGRLKTNAAQDLYDDLEPSVATDGKGRWIVVWRSSDPLGGTIGYDSDILMTTSADGGKTWSAPSAVNTDAVSDPGGLSSGGYGDCHPQIFTDGKGRWMVSWVRYSAAQTHAMVAVSSNNGATWSVPSVLQSKTVGSTMYIMGVPALASDGQGRWIATWVSRISDSSDFDVYYSTSANNGSTWSSPALLDNGFTIDNGDDNFTALACDGQGAWLSVWQSAGNLGGRNGSDVDILYSLSSDNGVTWSYPAPVNADAYSDSANDVFPRLVWDGKGKWVVSWVSNKLGGDNDIFYSTLPQGAAAGWSAPQTVNPWAATDSAVDVSGQFDYDLASDGLGHWLTLWSTSYHPAGGALDYDIYSALPTGAPVPVELGAFTAD